MAQEDDRIGVPGLLGGSKPAIEDLVGNPGHFVERQTFEPDAECAHEAFGVERFRRPERRFPGREFRLKRFDALLLVEGALHDTDLCQ